MYVYFYANLCIQNVVSKNKLSDRNKLVKYLWVVPIGYVCDRDGRYRASSIAVENRLLFRAFKLYFKPMNGRKETYFHNFFKKYMY